MKNLRNNNDGLVLLILIAIAVAIAGYVVINNFLSSEEGKEVQETADQLIQTLDETQDLIR
jgi:flagellar basal body-associated protein FliL